MICVILQFWTNCRMTHYLPYLHSPLLFTSLFVLVYSCMAKRMSELIFTFTDHQTRQLTTVQLPSDLPWISYSLFMRAEKTQIITVGRFGRFEFISGNYIYSGSARRNLRARVNRHLKKQKKLRWHIDYFLSAPTVDIVKVLVSTISECVLVAAGGGRIIVPGFGASDCRSGCGSHLRIL